ncbi:hypothetical protein LNP05_29975 [Klebsiella pneumoniae subsp. pneumoniae]|nr:hypothetical protein [Klebsiella pneumoniae subsp. pneumoniae]
MKGSLALPEEPLRNACIAGMSVADNLALRNYDRPPLCRQGWFIDRRAIHRHARELIGRFQVRPADPGRPIGTLSGGNVQRERYWPGNELEDVFGASGLQSGFPGWIFLRVALIHQRIVEARNQGRQCSTAKRGPG